MASPLRWFRRHAKILMVVLGSAAMAIFGLGPVFDTLSRGSNRTVNRENEVLARWKGGEINRDDLSVLQTQHYQTQRFLNALQKNAMDIKKDEFRPIAQPVQPIQEGEQSVVDEQLISRFILAKKAEAEGIVVSDGVIDDYLGMASSFAGFSKNDLVQINQEANQGGCSVENIRRHLRLELLAQQMQLLAGTGMTAMPNPVEAMSMFRQVSERVECQVLPISVDEFLAKIDETPSKMELKKLYEEGKFDYPDPTGKNPGFKIRNKVKVQYLTADFETFVQNEMNKLTDEQVQAEYDRLVEMKSDLVMEVVPEETDNSIKINDPPPALPGDESKSTEAAPEGADGVDAPPKMDPADAGSSDAPAENTDDDSTDAVDSEKATDEEGDDAPSDSEVDSDGDQSLNVRRSKMQLVSLTLQDAEQPEGEEQGSADEETATETTSDEPQSSEEPAVEAPVGDESQSDEEATGEQDSAEEEAAETMPAEGQPEDSQPAETVADAEQTDSGIADSAPEETDKVATDKAATDKAATVKSEEEADEIGPLLADEPKVEKRVLPLKDVAEEIKREMVKDAASKAVDEAVKKTTATLTSYHTLHMRWELTDEKKRGPEPDPIDAKSIADKYNLIANETEMVDEVQLADTGFGKIQMPIPVRMPDGRQTLNFSPLAVIVFDRFDAIKVYDPLTAKDFMNQNTHVYWLSEKQDARIPEFEECESDIVKFWKSRRALEMATAEADKIAKTVNEQEKSLSEVYGERVSPTGEFSWFSTFGQTLFGQPIGVVSPGPQFMKTTFSLNKMQAGVAANQPKDIVYVVQMLSNRQPLDELGSDYLENQFFRFKAVPRDVATVSQIYRREMNLDWNQELADEMDLKIYGR